MKKQSIFKYQNKETVSSNLIVIDSSGGRYIARGNYIKFRNLIRRTAGSFYYLKYKETPTIRRNSKPKPPTKIKTSLFSYGVRRIPYYFLAGK